MEVTDVRMKGEKKRLVRAFKAGASHTISWNEFFNAFDEFVTMPVSCYSDLLEVLVIHLGQDVDANLLSVENLAQLLQTQTKIRKAK